MSVFTPVTAADAGELLQRFDLGRLQQLQGIASGIENTNYFLTTEDGEYVLTLFELLSAEELPFFLDLMSHLAHQDVPCPLPVANRAGYTLESINGKPSSIVSRLSGLSIVYPKAWHCSEVGRTLAKIHVAGQNFGCARNNPRGATWWKAAAPRLLPMLSVDDAQLLLDEIRYQALHRLQDLPSGIIHADLFRDNALFEHDQLTGVIDFYFACTDRWLYDVAITINDWCVNEMGQLDEDRCRSLLNAYHAVRPLTAIELGAWPVVLRAAALRFWVSRLLDLHFPRAGEITHAKNPDHFRHILQQHITHASDLRALWIN